VSIAADGGYDFALLRGVIETNDQHYARIADKVIAECNGSVQGLTIAAWGLTFKAHTDDLRDSPAIKILTMLHNYGANIVAYDPTSKAPYSQYPWITIAEGASVLAVLTEWPEFSELDPSAIASRLMYPRVVDSRNVLNREKFVGAGFSYRGVGR
jgi:UDPglucose 6-dehydrogenase